MTESQRSQIVEGGGWVQAPGDGQQRSLIRGVALLLLVSVPLLGAGTLWWSGALELSAVAQSVPASGVMYLALRGRIGRRLGWRPTGRAAWVPRDEAEHLPRRDRRNLY